MSKNKTLSCIIDDIIRYPEDKNIDSFGSKNLFFKKEVYHLIPNKETSTQNILTCIQKTDAIWHQLILLTAIDVNQFTGKELNKENLKEICEKTTIFIIGAYDSEGYIF